MHPHRLDKIRLAYLGIVGASNLFDWPPGAIPKLLFNIWKHTLSTVPAVLVRTLRRRDDEKSLVKITRDPSDLLGDFDFKPRHEY